MEKSKKKGIIIIACVCAFVLVVSCLCFLFFYKKASVYEFANGPTAGMVTVSGDSMICEMYGTNGYSNFNYKYSGTYTKNGEDGYINFNLKNAKSKELAFNLVVFDDSTDLPIIEEMGSFMNDKIVYNVLSGDFNLKKGVVAQKDEVLAIISTYKLVLMIEQDLFFTVGSSLDLVKDYIYESMIAVYGDATDNNLIESPESIVSIKVGEDDFVTTTAGVFDVVVTYDTNKTIELSIKVGEDEESPENGIVTDGFGGELFFEIGTTFEDALGVEKIKLYSEEDYVFITSDMVTGFDTSKEGTTVITLTYKNYTRNFEMFVYDPENIKVQGIANMACNNMVAKGEDLNCTFKAKMNNGTLTDLLEPGDEGVTVTGFDKNVLGAQLVTISYGGVSTKEVVYVYDSTNNIVIDIEEVDNVEIGTDGEIVGEPKITLKKADGTTQVVNITKSMLDSKRLESGENGMGYISYELDGVTFWNRTFYSFAE